VRSRESRQDKQRLGNSVTEYHYTCDSCGNRTRVFLHGEEHDGKSDMVVCDQCGDDVTVELVKAN
jgi:transcription elongation factor Elf1